MNKHIVRFLYTLLKKRNILFLVLIVVFVFFSPRFFRVFHFQDKPYQENSEKILAAMIALEENIRLKSLLNAPLDKFSSKLTGRVIARTPFLEGVILNVGHQEGAALNQALITEEGLAGRIIKVSPHMTQALLLTDLNSKIPVEISGKKIPGILAGDRSPFPLIKFMEKAELGDPIITSGQGLPFGIPVGTVKSIQEGVIRVSLYANPNQLLFVRLAS